MNSQTMLLIAFLGGLIMLTLLAVVNQLSDNETSLFTYAVGIVLLFAVLFLSAKAGLP